MVVGVAEEVSDMMVLLVVLVVVEARFVVNVVLVGATVFLVGYPWCPREGSVRGGAWGSVTTIWRDDLHPGSK